MSATPSPASRAYPAALSDAETAAIAERRIAAGVDPNPPRVGLALSGGGIRSATFCLGLNQALARRSLVRRMDFLSTVSGGGYFGGFLGALLSRPKASVAEVERELAHNESWPVSWLRDNGRFLSPNGAGDDWQTAAVALRNWVSLQTVLLTFGFLVVSVGVALRTFLANGARTTHAWLSLEQFFWQHPLGPIWFSPWCVLPAVPFVFLMLPTGLLYWLTQARFWVWAARGLLPAIGLAREHDEREFAALAQSKLTRVFTLGVVATVVLLAFACIDTAGQTAYLYWADRDFTFPTKWAGMTGAGTIGLALVRKLAVYAGTLFTSKRVRIPTNVIAGLAGFAWLALLLVALAVAACGFAWDWEPAADGDTLRVMFDLKSIAIAAAVALVGSWIFSRSFGFVNLSSMQQLYGARLARAYLGASNPLRRAQSNHTMTELLPGDDLAFDAYAPHAAGGPLHLINVTVNETLSGKTQIERRDRKGVNFAVSPCGLSAGVESHALWGPARRDDPTGTRGIVPIHAGSAGFHALCEDAHAPHAPQRTETLPLGRWIAISGAAFTTGTGAHTSTGLCLLLGLANIRLGYWWDSGVRPRRRRESHRPNLLEWTSRQFSRFLPVQTCLVNEFLARFHGPGRRYWYLSDGGHFENTACYELIRRRVPFIVCSDAGQDPDYNFADLADLTRKARIDFGAEISVVRRRDSAGPTMDGLPALEDLVHPAVRQLFGAPEDFRADPAGGPRPHAILARIRFLDTGETSWLLLIKPSLSGDEPVDVSEYQRAHALFPQEPTTDQYFDEAQWESYRKLGEHIGALLFEPLAAIPGEPTWSPASLTPPQVPAA